MAKDPHSNAVGHAQGVESASTGLDTAPPGQSRDNGSTGNGKKVGQSDSGNQSAGSTDSPPGQSNNGDLSGNSKKVGQADSGHQNAGTIDTPPGQSSNGDSQGDGKKVGQADSGNQNAGSTDTPPGQSNNGDSQGNGKKVGQADSGNQSAQGDNAGPPAFPPGQSNNGDSQGNGKKVGQADSGADPAQGDNAPDKGQQANPTDSADAGSAANTRDDSEPPVRTEEELDSPPQLAMVYPSDGELDSAWSTGNDAASAGGLASNGAFGLLQVTATGKSVPTALKGPRVSDSASQQQSESVREIARLDLTPALESGSADERALDSVMEALAGPVQAVPASGDAYVFTESWHDLFATARSSGDEMIHLVSRSNTAYWLTNAALVLVAVELVRLRSERASKRLTPIRWPEIIAPSGLA